jgi:hypothetical protein
MRGSTKGAAVAGRPFRFGLDRAGGEPMCIARKRCLAPTSLRCYNAIPS